MKLFGFRRMSIRRVRPNGPAASRPLSAPMARWGAKPRCGTSPAAPMRGCKADRPPRLARNRATDVDRRLK